MRKELFKAIATNDKKLLEELLENVTTANDLPLMSDALKLAMQNNHLEFVQKLLGSKALLNLLRISTHPNDVFNVFFLIWVAKNGHLMLLQHLLQIPVVSEHAHDENNLALRFALENGHLEVVEALLEVSEDNPPLLNQFVSTNKSERSTGREPDSVEESVSKKIKIA